MSTPNVPIRSLKDTEVFQPTTVGRNQLSNKIVFAPSTRYRSLDDHTPSDLNLQYYGDRTKYKGSLVVTEGTFVAPIAGGFRYVPGIYTDRHVKAWRKITDEVHRNGSFISVQAWFLGRAARPDILKQEGSDYVAPSAIYPDERAEKFAQKSGNLLREPSAQELHDLIHVEYTNAAKKAIEAGFDYFELHGAHGYFLDTFFHPSTNQRTDKYGGSIENRARFVLELIDHLSNVIGADKVAIRISPWATVQGVLGYEDSVHPIATFGYFLHELQKRANNGKELAYVSIVEPRVNGIFDVDPENQVGSNRFVSDVWQGIILKSGNYTYDAPNFTSLLNDIKDKRTIVGFSRFYISNPDLVQKIHDGTPLTHYQREYFYSKTNLGYNTYSAENFDEEAEAKREGKEIEGVA